MSNKYSGGWRLAPTSTEIFNSYKPKEYNAGLLDSVGNPIKGKVDAAISKSPIDELITNGFSKGTGGGGSVGGLGSSGITSNVGHEATDGWGANRYGYNVGFDAKLANIGAALGGPLGALAGVKVSQDPLGQFMYGQLLAQENRQLNPADTIAGASDAASSPVGGDGSTISQAQSDAMAIALNDAANGVYGGGGGGGGTYADRSNAMHEGTGSNAPGGFAKGGLIGGFGTSTSDSNNVNVSKGEFVVKASSVKKYGKGLLEDINSGKFKG